MYLHVYVLFLLIDKSSDFFSFILICFILVNIFSKKFVLNFCEPFSTKFKFWKTTWRANQRIPLAVDYTWLLPLVAIASYRLES